MFACHWLSEVARQQTVDSFTRAIEIAGSSLREDKLVGKLMFETCAMIYHRSRDTGSHAICRDQFMRPRNADERCHWCHLSGAGGLRRSMQETTCSVHARSASAHRLSRDTTRCRGNASHVREQESLRWLIPEAKRKLVFGGRISPLHQPGLGTRDEKLKR